MKKQQLFKLIFLLFLGVVLFFLYDMSRQTTAPWNKKKHLDEIISNKK